MHVTARTSCFKLFTFLLLLLATSHLALASTPTSTAIGLTATPGPYPAGGAITLNVGVNSSIGAPTGIVRFLDGAPGLSDQPVSSNGTASFTVGNLAPGMHYFWAAFQENASFYGCASVLITINVPASAAPAPPAAPTPPANPTPTTIGLTVTPGSAVAGGSVTMNVGVNSSKGTPTGIVRFLDGAPGISDQPVSPNGTANFTVTNLTAGPHYFWAAFQENASFYGSASVLITINVPAASAKTSTSITLTPTPTAAVAGQAVSMMANVKGATSGTLTFTDGANLLGSSAVSASGQAVLVSSTLAQGTHTLAAQYAGTSTTMPSASPNVSLVVAAASKPPVVACAAAPTSVNAGDIATATATASSPTNRPVSVHFTTTSGSLNANGNSASLNTSGVSGKATITCTATDDLGATASTTTSVWVNAGQGEQALTAFNFTDSVGVNIHLHYGNTAYFTDFPGTLKAMVNLGIKHYRNGIDPWAGPAEYTNAEALAANGIKGDWLIDTRDTAANINAIVANAPNSVEAFEGPNEDDVNAGAVLANFVVLLHNTVRANPATANVPIYAPTLIQFNSITSQSSFAPNVDYANMHDYYYPRYPETPAYGGNLFGCGFYGTMAFNICVSRVNTPGKPVVSTETGYISGTQSDQALGRYFPRILFAHLGQKVMRTYLYELLENVDSPGYGIMQSDFTPKPAYTAVQSLIRLFKDGSFATPGKLQYTLSGQTANVNRVLFQKTDGTWMLAIWLGVPSANPVFPYETYTVTPQTVNIVTQTPVGTATISALDDNGGLTTQSAYANLTSTPISVTDRVTILSLAPAAQ